MNGTTNHQWRVRDGAARHLKTALMLATPVLLPVVGAAMLLYGWTTP